MKLYGAPKPAPNPRRVRMFLAEKGIDLAETPIDLMTREHKSPEYRQKNSLGQVPTLELDDGETILQTGDSVVQNGTRHRWSNRGQAPATLAIVLLGAPRD